MVHINYRINGTTEYIPKLVCNALLHDLRNLINCRCFVHIFYTKDHRWGVGLCAGSCHMDFCIFAFKFLYPFLFAFKYRDPFWPCLDSYISIQNGSDGYLWKYVWGDMYCWFKFNVWVVGVNNFKEFFKICFQYVAILWQYHPVIKVTLWPCCYKSLKYCAKLNNWFLPVGA